MLGCGRIAPISTVLSHITHHLLRGKQHTYECMSFLQRQHRPHCRCEFQELREDFAVAMDRNLQRDARPPSLVVAVESLLTAIDTPTDARQVYGLSTRDTEREI